MYSPNINAKCNLPSFMLETQEDAEMCGKFRGNIAATVFTIFTIIIFVSIIYSVYDVTKQTNTKIAKEKRTLAATITNEIEKQQLISEAVALENKIPLLSSLLMTIAMIITIMIIWNFVPKMFINGAIQNFLVKDYEREAMERSGLSRSEAFRQQQKLYESKQQADSRIDAARITADAYSNAMRDQSRMLRDTISNNNRYRFH